MYELTNDSIKISKIKIEDYIIDELLKFCNSSNNDFNLWNESCINCSSLLVKDMCNLKHPKSFSTLVYICYITILLVASIGNTLVVYLVSSISKMRTITNFFIANLAIGDLCMVVFCIPFSFISTLILQYWPFGSFLCVTVNYLQATSVFVSAR